MPKYTCVYSAKDGRAKPWYYKIEALGPDGTRKSLTRRGFATAAEANTARITHLERLATQPGELPVLTVDEDQPVAEFLCEWLAAQTGAAGTLTAKKIHVQLYLVPHTGGLTRRQLLSDRTGIRITKIYADIRAAGMQGRNFHGQPLSRNTEQALHKTFAQAMKAMASGTDYRNPLDRLEGAARPRPVLDRPKTTWSEEEAQRFTVEAAPHFLYAAFCLALTFGMRPEEVLGYQVDDIDYEAKLLIPTRFVTTHDGHRLVKPEGKTGPVAPRPLDAGTALLLRHHEVLTKQWKLANGPAWVDTPWLFVWPSSKPANQHDQGHHAGAPVHSATVARQFKALIGRLGLPLIRRYDLRHTYATLNLDAGAPVEAVSEMLGHSLISTTWRFYVDPKKKAQEAQARFSKRMLGHLRDEPEQHSLTAL